MQVAVSLPHSSSLRTLARRRRARAASRAEGDRRAKNVEWTAKRPKRDTKRDRRLSASRDSNHAQDGLEFNPPVFLDVRKACAGKKVLIMGLPGAFTPC